MAAVVALLAVIAIAGASLGAAYAARTQAQIAADGAALAAAVATYPGTSRAAPWREASVVAMANGASTVSCACPVNSTLYRRTVRVVTEVSISVPIFGVLQIRAAARAEFDPRRWLGR